ncbi:MAG: NADH-quinone oxidoreductase subunit A [Candidatus Bathyarchaeota archaeon]|nr:NADH-quinone oxidoreductase subunit A [Candidatus Bathyarchaeota archaeon]
MTEAPFTLGEFATAFILILAASSLIYIFGRWLSPKSVQSENGQSTYACGEKAAFPKLKINVSLYKYLIYFVILDSSVLLVAFASLALRTANMLLFMFYLFIVLVSGFLLLGGGDQ